MTDVQEDSTINTHLPGRTGVPAARKSRTHVKLSAALIALLGVFIGCGGGGNSNNNHPPPGNAYISRVSGSVTDGNGGPVIGASVALTGYAAVTTTQFGQFTVPNVQVPAGQNSVIAKIQATATVNGQPWSGQNMVEVIRGNPLTENCQVSLSQTSTQGGISGQLTDATTHQPLAAARVFIADGPYTGGTAPNTYQFFTLASSYTAYTDANGNYTIQGLPQGSPAFNYTVTASFVGYINQTTSNVTVTPGSTTSGVNFALAASSNSPALPTVTGLGAAAITLPVAATRAAADPQQVRGVEAIKLNLLQKLGFLNHQATDLSRAAIKGSKTRSAPAGSEVETVIVWDYNQVNNLLGFDILRSTTAINQFGSIALLRDPLGDRYEDDDPALTPDTTYYYSIASVDTINFPVNGSEGSPVNPPVAVEPLDPLALNTPAPNATVSGVPTFTWGAIARASTYTIMLYNTFPNYQSNVDPNAVQPIWTASTSGTSQVYTGNTALVTGTTYYWAVLCQDSAGGDFSISPIQKFVQQ